MKPPRPFLFGIVFIVAAVAVGGLVLHDQILQGFGTTALRPDDPRTVALGGEIYRRECATCHGTNLEGQPNWRRRLANGRLPAPPHDETGHTWHHPEAQLFELTKHSPAALAGGDYQSDMPTENGSALHAGRQPEAAATLVARLREAGAIIMGKTVTTEFAVLSPGKTRNPHDPDRTPGGSSSGSAAAVASFMVPAALGSQTNGSMIRPASFCGVCGYKPTFGLISRGGVFRTSQPLDTMGVFGRSVQDTALIAQTMIGFDAADPDTRALARPPLVATAGEEPPLAPTLAYVKSPVWDAADADVAEGFAELVDTLGGHCREVPLPSIFDQAVPNQRILHCTGLARYLGREYDSSPDGLSDKLRDMIEEGRQTQAVDYLRALEWRDVLYAALTELFDEFDAIITPAATGEAPTGLDSTGNPVFCALWTYSGVPAINLPLLQGSNGLPIGVQLVGRRRDDARLLRTARWLVRELGQPELA